MASMLPYPDRFQSAQRYVKLKDTLGGKPLTQEAQLLLYALGQQALNGPNNTPKPWSWNLTEAAKWEGWKRLGDMNSVEAMRLYVRSLEEEQPDWYTLLQKAPPAVAVTPSQAEAPEQVSAASTAPPEPPRTPKATLSYARPGVWTALPLQGKRPLPRYEQGAALVGDELYVVGGNYGGRYLNDLWVFNLAATQWSQLTPIAASADSAATASATANPTAATADGAAPAAPGTPTAADAATAAAAIANGDAKPAATAATNGTAAATTAAAANTALAPVAGHTLTAWNGKLLVLGGHTKGKDSSVSIPIRSVDLKSLEVTVVPAQGQAPQARGGHTATRIGNLLYVFGGEDGARRALADLHILDLGSMTWSQPEVKGPKKPPARSAAAAVAYGGRYIVLFGGGSVASCYSDVWVLDTEDLSWSQPTVSGPKVAPRAGHVGALLGSSWHIIGGGNNVKGCTDLLSLDLSTLPSGSVAWTSVNTIPLRDPLSSEGVSVVAVPSAQCLLAFGGYNGKYQNTLSVYLAGPPSPVGDSKRDPTVAEASVEAPATAVEGVGAVTANGHSAAASRASSISGKLGGPVLTPSASFKDAKTGEARAASSASGGGAAEPALSQKASPVAPAQSPDVIIAELRAALDAARKEAEVAIQDSAAAKESAGLELALMRKQLTTTQTALNEATRALEMTKTSMGAALSSEQSRVLKLEAEAAELQAKLQDMAALEKELAAYRRAEKDAESKKGSGGFWGYIAGPVSSS